MKVKIINAPSDLGVTIDGASMGPSIIKKNIINNAKIDEIIDLECDCSNKSHDSKDLEKNFDRVNLFNEKLYSTLLSNKNKDTITITIGGDHSIAIASALASQKYEYSLGIIWIDTHPDFNTFETTITGNNGNRLTSFHNNNFISNNNTIIIGARDIDPLEQINLEKANIKVYSTDDVKSMNIKELVDNSIKKALDNTNGIHVSIDIDVLDPEIAPGISVGFKNGLTKEELFEIIDNILLYKDKIKSFDIVEFNPLNDIDNKTLQITLEIINKLVNAYK